VGAAHGDPGIPLVRKALVSVAAYGSAVALAYVRFGDPLRWPLLDTTSPPTTVVGPAMVQLLQLSALAELELDATQQFRFASVPLFTKTALAAIGSRARRQAVLAVRNAAIAVVVMLTVLTLGPQIAVTKFAKAVFNGCVRTAWTALSVPFELDVLQGLPTVKP
jgi:hypothetical protein